MLNLNPMINVIAETSKDSQIYPLLDARDEMLKILSNDYEIIKTDMLNLLNLIFIVFHPNKLRNIITIFLRFF
jgi:hypothetical protein